MLEWLERNHCFSMAFLKNSLSGTPCTCTCNTHICMLFIILWGVTTINRKNFGIYPDGAHLETGKTKGGRMKNCWNILVFSIPSPYPTTGFSLFRWRWINKVTTVYHKIALASNEPKIFANGLISIESQPIKVVFVVVVQLGPN